MVTTHHKMKRFINTVLCYMKVLVFALLRLANAQHTLRLVGGSRTSEGRVEIFHNNTWGTVCDDFWDINDARVICRQLGYPDAIIAPGSARFGTGSGQIWLDDVNCQGNETSILYCGHRGWGINNCRHYEDASVVCYGPGARGDWLSACVVAGLVTPQEEEKKRKHQQRVLDVEMGSFTRVVFGTNGGMGAGCNCFLKHLAEKLSETN